MPRGIKNMSLLDRLLWNTAVANPDECWLWQGGKNNLGYGLIRDGEKMRTTHRVSYEEHNNTKIPKMKCVCHRCDNPSCVNPDHLWIGDLKDNSNDMYKKLRANPFGTKNKIKCKYCSMVTTPTMIKRWHDDKCKHKP